MDDRCDTEHTVFMCMSFCYDIHRYRVVVARARHACACVILCQKEGKAPPENVLSFLEESHQKCFSFFFAKSKDTLLLSTLTLTRTRSPSRHVSPTHVHTTRRQRTYGSSATRTSEWRHRTRDGRSQFSPPLPLPSFSIVSFCALFPLFVQGLQDAACHSRI
jgi:hypothetical protein